MGQRFLTTAVALALFAAPSAVSAGPALLFDAANGKVLYAEDQDDQWHPASLTKIMTAYLVFEALKSGRLTTEQKIPVSENAHAQPPSKVGLPVGAEMTVDLAIRTLIVKSANDVAVMLAEAVGGTEAAFIQRMNETAQRLGMTRTKFVNANGLPAPEQVTTARDLARLSRAVLHDFPEHASLWAMADVTIGKRRLRSHNSLLRTYEGADGLKTGFICDSGFNVVASASRDGHKLVAVVLGEVSGRERSVRAASLLEHGFQTYDWKQIFNTTTIDTLPLDTETKPVHSVRSKVVSWDCGGRKKPRLVKHRKRKPGAQATAKKVHKARPATHAPPAANKAKPKSAGATASSTTR
jgi:D-alanyl-D-alanine carboxypeptidase